MSTELKRVNPAEFPEKFRRQFAEARRGTFIGLHDAEYAKTRCFACAVGIEAIDSVGLNRAYEGFDAWDDSDHDGDSAWQVFARLTDLQPDYVQGLSDGWEFGRRHRLQNWMLDNEAYIAGREDGTAAYAACEAAGMFS